MSFFFFESVPKSEGNNIYGLFGQVQKIENRDHLCVDSSPGKSLTITSVGNRSLGSGVEGEEAKVKNKKSEAAEGNRVAGDASCLGPSVGPG